jgi:hypothetical protein
MFGSGCKINKPSRFRKLKGLSKKSKSVSRVLYVPIARDSLSFIWFRSHNRNQAIYPPRNSACAECKTSRFDRGLFDFSTRKVYHALGIATKAVSSYLTFSPFPFPNKSEWVVCFLWHFLSPPIGGSFPLGSTMLCVARTFLPDNVRAIRQLAYDKNKRLN